MDYDGKWMGQYVFGPRKIKGIDVGYVNGPDVHILAFTSVPKVWAKTAGIVVTLHFLQIGRFVKFGRQKRLTDYASCAG